MKRLAALALLAAASGCDNQPAAPASAGAPGLPAAPAAVPAANPEPKGEVTYHFGAAETHTTITFESKTEITNILGQTSRVTGSSTIDFEKGGGKVALVVPALSLRTGMDDRDRAMLGKTWLDAKQFPTVEFKADKASRSGPSAWKLDGEFTLHGVKKPLSIEAEVKRVPPVIGKLLGEGDWIRVRTSFKIALADYDIKIAENALATVEPVWNVAIEIFGGTVAPKDLAALPDIFSADPTPMVRVPKPEKEGLPGTLYEFGTKPQLTTLTADSKMEAENIRATVNVVAGFAGVDKEKGAGQIRFRTLVRLLRTGIKERDTHLLGAQWLDAEKFPRIEFESTRATRKDPATWQVEGNFSLHGVTRPLSLEVKSREIPAELVKKAHWGERAGLGFTGSFRIKLSDFGVKVPEIAITKVNDEWTISFDLIALVVE
jgi:polyisoprenoid-binding protein YceI